MSRVARDLSLVAGGVRSENRLDGSPVSFPRRCNAPAKAGAEAGFQSSNQCWRLPRPPQPTLCEFFAAHPRDGGWVGFLLAQVDDSKPLLWVQERMAVLESGRVHPPGLPTQKLIHVEVRDSRDALWAMEEGLRCASLSAVIGEIWGDPKALDFTATRRLAVASEHSGVAAFLVRLGGHANLSGARMRWRIASAQSLVNDLDPKAPGLPAWDVELFRARAMPPGRWSIAHETHAFHLVAEPGDRTMDEVERLRA